MLTEISKIAFFRNASVSSTSRASLSSNSFHRILAENSIIGESAFYRSEMSLKYQKQSLSYDSGFVSFDFDHFLALQSSMSRSLMKREIVE